MESLSRLRLGPFEGPANGKPPALAEVSDSFGGTWRNVAIAGPAWGRFGRGCTTPSGRPERTSSAASSSAAMGRSQCTADVWTNQVKWHGMKVSPSYVGEPECNGITERFLRTLKEGCLYLQRLASLEELRVIVGDLIAHYKTKWVIERLGYWALAEARGTPQAEAP